MHDTNRFYGNERPTFDPTIPNVNLFSNNFLIGENICWIFNNILTKELCDDLINQFETKEKHPVGVDGYSNTVENLGSVRTNAWAGDLSYIISQPLMNNAFLRTFVAETETKLNSVFKNDYSIKVPDEIITKNNRTYHLLGSTPFMRFMKYINGGKHVPHHDSSYINEKENYVTLFSWVLFLNSPKGSGGRFQFVDDGQLNMHPKDWNRSDHRKMSNSIIKSITPSVGTILVFPHWLCHQVEEYVGDDCRYIIRGDVAYGYYR